MKKIVLASLLTASSIFALDLGSTAKSIGGSMGITTESLGNKLYDMVKDKAPQTTEQAKSYCTQASTYKSFVGIADDGMMAKAIDICAQKASSSLSQQAEESVESALPAIKSLVK